MRLSTNSIYSMNTQSVLQQQSRMAKLGQQLASGKALVTPADDPRAASQALKIDQAIATEKQYASARDAARNALGVEESQLNTISQALQAATPLLVKAGNDALSDADRASVAADFEGLYSQLLNSANAKDGNGRYIFGGHATDKPPFVETDGGVRYQGDEGRRELRVDDSRLMAINDTGSRVFMSVTDSGQYVGTAAPDNAGTAVFSGLQGVDTSAEDYGHAFDIRFDNDGDQLSYTVVDTTDGSVVSENTPYVEGERIALGDGMQVKLEGRPEAGDEFTFARNREADNNLLDTVAGVISALKQGTETPADAAAFENTINSAHRKLSNSLDNVLTVRASLGARVNELEDTLDVAGESRMINYQSNLSEIRDLDYVPAISDYSLAQVALQFSQQTFSDIQQMSLFSLTR